MKKVEASMRNGATKSDIRPTVTVVTVTYNSGDSIADHLASLEPSVISGDIRVVVSDNASSDGTVEYARAHAPWAEVLENGCNLGFAQGCNAGFSRVDTDYVLFLNADTVVNPEAIQTLIRFMNENPRAGLVGPAMRYPGGQLQYAGMELTPRGILAGAAGLGRWAFPSRRVIEPMSAPFRTNWVCGACLMLRSSAYRAVGMMDPRFFLYFEETDLCRKLEERGFEIWAVGEAVIKHEGGASAKQSGRELHEDCIAEYFFESRYYYLEKNFGKGTATATELGELALLAGRTVYDRARRRERNLLRERLAGPVLRTTAPPAPAANP